MDSTTVTAGCLQRELPRAVRLLSEVVRTPTFPDAEFEKQRKQLLTSLAISAKEPATIAQRELRRALYGDHPYARTETGEPKDVAALTPADLRGWWERHIDPERSVLIFAGVPDVETCRSLAENTFGPWRVEKAIAAEPPKEAPAAQPTRIILVDQPAAIQSQIRIGQRAFRRDHADYAVGRVVGDYFGGSFSSRLNEVIRVQKGLTYGASGGFSPERWDGRFVVSTFSKTESTAAAVKAALDEIERVRREGPTEQELADTKSAFRGRLALQRETPQQVAGELWRAELYGLPADHVEKTLARATAVSPEECLSFAREWIDPSKLVIVVVGSAEQLRAELEKIAPVTVIKKSE